MPTLKVGYVGRLSAGKRFQDLITALGLLGAQPFPNPNPYELWVAGGFVDPAFEKGIQKQIEDLLTQGFLQPSTVQFLGHQSDLTAFWPQLDLLVLPSLNEPFGRVLIEAMAHDVLCAGATSGGIPEILAPDANGELVGFLFPPEDPPTLACVLETVQALPPQNRVTILQNARRRVQERFTIEAQIPKLLALYAECLV